MFPRRTPRGLPSPVLVPLVANRLSFPSRLYRNQCSFPVSLSAGYLNVVVALATDTIATTVGCSRVSHSPSRSLSLPRGSSILLSLSPCNPSFSIVVVVSLSLSFSFFLSVRRSSVFSVEPAKTVSQQQSSEIPRTRYEFTFLLLYSTLACPPFCLLESLVCLADLRLPYVSAARLSHRLHSFPLHSFSRSRPRESYIYVRV